MYSNAAGVIIWRRRGAWRKIEGGGRRKEKKKKRNLLISDSCSKYLQNFVYSYLFFSHHLKQNHFMIYIYLESIKKKVELEKDEGTSIVTGQDRG